MAMALAMLYSGDALLLVAGYESGHAAVYKLDSEGSWSTLYLQNPHSQPGTELTSSIYLSIYLSICLSIVSGY